MSNRAIFYIVYIDQLYFRLTLCKKHWKYCIQCRQFSFIPVLGYAECFSFLICNARISMLLLPLPLSGLLSFILQPLIKLSVCFYPKALLSLPHLNLL